MPLKKVLARVNNNKLTQSGLGSSLRASAPQRLFVASSGVQLASKSRESWRHGSCKAAEEWNRRSTRECNVDLWERKVCNPLGEALKLTNNPRMASNRERGDAVVGVDSPAPDDEEEAFSTSLGAEEDGSEDVSTFEDSSPSFDTESAATDEDEEEEEGREASSSAFEEEDEGGSATEASPSTEDDEEGAGEAASDDEQVGVEAEGFDAD